MESILNEVETFPAFLKMNSTTDIYSKFSKIFRATISRGRFCLNVLQEITVYWCNWFYFPVRSIWHLKEWFSGKCLVRRGTRTPCTACLKRILFHCTIIHIASVDCVQAEDRLHETLSIYLYHKTPSFTNIYIIYYKKYIIYIYQTEHRHRTGNKNMGYRSTQTAQFLVNQEDKHNKCVLPKCNLPSPPSY